MSSNILAGERRWASARRSGMTVLGKVTVPKPVNLPSQRLENHGMDPNVEIVPKGTLGWGNRPSSSASNPWGLSSLSSTAEGYGSSPGHPSGRPSSSGSRPSTSGSEMTHDRGGNAWGLSSRPSSASGDSASNQKSLTSLRPHSAETRPASSQISRFAELYTDSGVALYPVASAEKAGLSFSSEKERFSLSSGDFPMLNAITEGSLKNSDSRDQGSHSRPSSASGRVAKKDNSEMAPADVESENANAWKPRSSDDIHQRMEKWHGEPPRYHNANIPPPHFDGWRGHSVNPPGVWYRGLPPGPPYGAPVTPGGFPVEPFPFYCPPQIPPSGLPNPQPVPLSGPGPMGHPKNGELYRPPMPEAFVRPGIPFRPGFYHGPMSFEGYYGPAMSYCSPNEREIPFKGMAAGPPVYNRYPACDGDPVPCNIPGASDSTTSYNRAGKNGSSVKGLSETVETAHIDDAPGQVILKQNDGETNQVRQFRDNTATHNIPNIKKRSQPGMALRAKEWGAENDSDDEINPRTAKHGLHSSSGPSDDHDGSDSITIRLKSYESRDNIAGDDICSKKSETAAVSFPILQHAPLAGDGGLISSAIARDPTLLQKIEGLNEKVRASDCGHDSLYPSQWEEQEGTDAIIGEIIVPLGDKTSYQTAAPRRRYGIIRGKAVDSSKLKFNDPGGGVGWEKKLASSIQASDLMSASDCHKNRTNATVIAAESLPERCEVGSEMVKATETQAQRTKMKELVKQKALQLQKEEEERTREQKAKALAKLEELSRRTPGGNTMIPNGEKMLLSGICQHEQGQKTLVEPSMTVADSLCVSPSLAMNPGIRSQVRESIGSWGDEPPDSVNYLPLETWRNPPVDPAALPSQSLPLKEELLTTSDSDCKVAPQFNESGSSRNEWSGYKQKQNVPAETNGGRKRVVTKAASQNNTGLSSGDSGIVSAGNVGSSSDSKTAGIPNVEIESTSHHRRSNRNTKSKHKPDDLPSASTFPSSTLDQSNPVDLVADNEMSKATHSVVDKGLIQTPIDGGAGGSSKQQSSLFSERALGGVNLHRKSQQSRRFARNQQTTRFLDKYHGNDNVVWAPIQPQNKMEPGTASGQKAVQESGISAKDHDQVQNNMRSKRAEMERYVPKPVAKELAQQGSVQQSASSSFALPVSDDAAEKAEAEFKTSRAESNLVAGNAAPVEESHVGDLRHNRQPKALGGWQQRGSSEQCGKGAESGSSLFASNPSENAHASRGQNESVKPESTNTRAEPTSSRELSASVSGNEWNDSGAGVSPHWRFQGNLGKAKRHALKGERSMGSDLEHEKNSISQNADKSQIQLQDPRIKQSDKITYFKENRGFEERALSHWQPKSGSTQNISGGSSCTGQSVAGEAGVTGKKGYEFVSEEHCSQNVKCDVEIESQVVPSVPESDILVEGHFSNQGQSEERKSSSFKGRLYSPTAGSVSADESTHTSSEESQNKQHFSSDYRRRRHQNVRPTANHEFRGDLNQERHSQNRHYEYQPVGRKNDKKFENFEEGTHGEGPKYKEKGNGYSRRGRGHIHGRQSSNVQVRAGYD